MSQTAPLGTFSRRRDAPTRGGRDDRGRYPRLLTKYITAPLLLLYDPRCPRHAVEGPPPLSGTLTHLRSKARRDDRTHSYYDDEGYKTRALSHRKHGP